MVKNLPLLVFYRFDGYSYEISISALIPAMRKEAEGKPV
jgi:hypothetical protein